MMRRIGLASLLLPSAAFAIPFQIGLSLDNVVTPGSTVTIQATLRNTGSEDIVFGSPAGYGASPSVAGGSTASASMFNEVGDWGGDFGGGFLGYGATAGSNNFGTVFDNLLLAPGEDFSFTFYQFVAPTLPLGSYTEVTTTFQIRFTDDIFGTARGFGATGVPCFIAECAPRVRFELGDTQSFSPLVFTDACVYTRDESGNVSAASEILSGPAGACEFAVGVPAPATLALFGTGLIGLAAARRRRASCARHGLELVI